MNYRFSNVLEPCAHNDLVIVTGRSLVPAARVDHRNEAVVVLFHVLVRETQLPEQFHSPDFEPDEMIGMIDHSHLIGLGIAHPHTAFIDDGVVVRRNVGRALAVTHSWELHLGLRFSRNDVTPSRKSAVSRIAAFSRTAELIWASSSPRAASLSKRLV